MNILNKWMVALGPAMDDTVAGWRHLRDVGKGVNAPPRFFSSIAVDVHEASTRTVLPTMLNQKMVIDAMMILLSSPAQHLVLKVRVWHNLASLFLSFSLSLSLSLSLYLSLSLFLSA